MVKLKILSICPLFTGLIIASAACGSRMNQEDESTANIMTEEAADTIEADTRPAGAVALLESYPDWITGYEDGNLVFADGTTMVYDDGEEKDFEYMLDNSSPADMFYVAYPDSVGVPEYLADAGRSRCEALFKKMYGNSASEVSSKLVDVEWFGGKVKFTRENGGAEQLSKVYEELKNHPELRKYLNSSGTFYWRTVRGAKRQSAHSYGIAFDIGVDHSDYWLWKNPGKGETAEIAYSNRIPKEIVEIFRKYGFIWGGAWYHFDTMHFEYRPEILKYAELSAER